MKGGREEGQGEGEGEGACETHKGSGLGFRPQAPQEHRINAQCVNRQPFRASAGIPHTTPDQSGMP